MSFAIIWMPEALKTFDDRIAYLNFHWTEKEIVNFRIRTNEYLEILKEEPYIAKKAGRITNVYIGSLIKQVSIIYRVKPLTKEIELLLFIDNRQDPQKIRKYRK